MATREAVTFVEHMCLHIAKISESFTPPKDYDKYKATYETDKGKEEDKLVNLTNDDTSFVVTSEYLLKLAQNANQILNSSQPAQKNRILKTLLANCKINEKRLQLALLKPFSVLSQTLENQNWLRSQVAKHLRKLWSTK